MSHRQPRALLIIDFPDERYRSADHVHSWGTEPEMRRLHEKVRETLGAGNHELVTGDMICPRCGSAWSFMKEKT
jgi:hypothetical protein